MSNDKQKANRALSTRFENDFGDRFVGRRDFSVGLWAGKQLGLSEENCTIYAVEVMTAGMMDPDPDVIVDKIANDFTERRVSIARGHILAQLSKSYRAVAADVVASSTAGSAQPNNWKWKY